MHFDLNNREIAFLIWMAIAFAFLWAKDKSGNFRQGLRRIMQAFFVRPILVSLALASLWIGLCVAVLSRVGIWDSGNLKTTLVWAVTFAFVTLFDINRISEDEAFFKQTLRDTVGATTLVVFIAELYSFPLLVELLLWPVLALMTGVQTYSEKKKEYEVSHRLASAILTTAGLAFFIYGIFGAVTEFKDFATWNNVRELFIPILLSVTYLPFIYAATVYFSYERTFGAFAVLIKDDSLRKYARRQAMLRLRLDRESLQRWKRQVGLFPPATRAEVRDLIVEVKRLRKREQHPPAVPEEAGWNPHLATHFLAADSLTTNDYHRLYDGEWGASSKMLPIGSADFLKDNIAYYIEGDEIAAKRLKLKLHVNHLSEAVQSEAHFLGVCEHLLRIAASCEEQAILEKIFTSQTIDVEVNGRRIRMKGESFANSAAGYWRVMIVDHSPTHRAGYD